VFNDRVGEVLELAPDQAPLPVSLLWQPFARPMQRLDADNERGGFVLKLA
jgi:hypothetical protein